MTSSQRALRNCLVGAVAAAATIALCLWPAAVSAAEQQAGKPALENPFFALCVTADKGGFVSGAELAPVLKELGYAGYAHVFLSGVPEALKALDDAGLKMFQVYVRVSVAEGKRKYDPRLKEVVKLLKGRGTMLGLLISGGKPSSAELDPRAVEIVREIADMAAQSGLRVALYPHVGDWLERVEDAVRVAKKVDRKNVGINFNLCHWLKVDDEANMEPLLKAAVPHLFTVTINGADSGCKGAGWDRLLQRLDRGSFDNARLLSTLRKLGYTGPVGVQCYGIKGDRRENLRAAMQAWQKISAKAAEK